MLSTIATSVDGMLEADKETYAELLKAKAKPWVLDDDTVQEVIASFKARRDDFWLYDEQLKRWAELPTLTGDTVASADEVAEREQCKRVEVGGGIEQGDY